MNSRTPSDSLVRILYHHRTLGDGAEGIHVREMVSAFRGLGHEVRVAALVGEQSNGASNNRSRWSSVSRLLPRGVYELAEVGYNVIGRRAVSRAIRQFQPDFVYDRYNSYSTAAVGAARGHGVPVLLEVNSPVVFERRAYGTRPLLFPGLAKRCERWICSCADHVFAVSTPLKEFLVSDRGVPESNITVLPNAANPQAFDLALDGTPIRRQLDIGHRTVIGFVGILRPWHGLDILLTAFSKLVACPQDLHLLLVGDGPMEPVLKDKVHRLNLGGRVTFTGRVSHASVQDYVAAMDIAVSPRATFYASPMKILEYMAMGVATVAPRMPNICDILEDGKDSLLFDPEDAESLAHALQTLVTHPSKARQLGAAARKKVETRFNWTRNAQRVIDRARSLCPQA